MPPIRTADKKHTELTGAASAAMVMFHAWSTYDEGTKSKWQAAFNTVKRKVLFTRNFHRLVAEDDLHMARIWAWHVLDEAGLDVCGFLMLPNGDLEVRRTCTRWRNTEFRAEFDLVFSFRRQELGIKQRKRAHKAFSDRQERIESGSGSGSGSASADPDALTLPPPAPLPMTLFEPLPASVWDDSDLQAVPEALPPLSPNSISLPDVRDMSAESIAKALGLPLPLGPM